MVRQTPTRCERDISTLAPSRRRKFRPNNFPRDIIALKRCGKHFFIDLFITGLLLYCRHGSQLVIAVYMPGGSGNAGGEWISSISKNYFFLLNKKNYFMFFIRSGFFFRGWLDSARCKTARPIVGRTAGRFRIRIHGRPRRAAGGTLNFTSFSITSLCGYRAWNGWVYSTRWNEGETCSRPQRDHDIEAR